MDGFEVIRSMFQQATAQGSRSTALNPIGWIVAITFSALLGALYIHAPDSVVKLLSWFAAALLLVYVFSYVFLLFKDRDALRSEKFSLSKMAMEKGVYGDSLTGSLAPERLLPPSQTNAQIPETEDQK